MTKRTEAFEQEHIDAFIEEERQPNHPERYTLPDHEGEALQPGQIGHVVLEGTDLAQEQFKRASNHFYEWE